MSALYETLAILSTREPVICGTTTNPPSGTFNAYPGSIIGRPGNIAYNNSTYVVPEGLLVIFDHAASAFGYTPYNQGGYRIMVPTSNPSAASLCAGIAALIGCGLDDNALTLSTAISTMRLRKLYMQCGPTCNVAQSLLQGEGFTCRQVHFLNVSDAPNSNDFDEGHTTIEVQVNGVWKLFEIPNDCIILDASNNQLSAKDVVVNGMANCHSQPIAVTDVEKGGESATGPGTFAYRAYYDFTLSTPTLLQTWHERIFQILAIQHPTLNQIWARDPGNLTTDQQNYVTSCGYTLTPATTFDSTFY